MNNVINIEDIRIRNNERLQQALNLLESCLRSEEIIVEHELMLALSSELVYDINEFLEKAKHKEVWND